MKGHHTRGSERLEKMLLYGIAGGSTARGNLDFAIDRGEVVVNGTWADD